MSKHRPHKRFDRAERAEHSARSARSEHIDPALDPLGDAVSQAWAGERLTAAQQRRHLRRLRGRDAGCGMRDAGSGAVGVGAPDGRDEHVIPLPASRIPHPASRPALQFAAAVIAFVVVGALLVLVFRSQSDTADGPPVAVRPYGTPQGWFYGGADLPGGGQIAFTRLTGGKAQIAVINADGSGLRTLSDGSWDQSSPTWSPDGTQLAFTGIRDGMPQVYVMPADGGVPQQRTIYRDSLNPTWSPDGERVAYISNQDHKIGVYVMDATGTHLPALSGGLALDGDEFPRWSPDGSRLAFELDGAIYVVNADGSGLRELTAHPAGDVMPEWSPDGRWIAFSSERDGNAEIYLIDPNDGSVLRRLTDTPDDELAPAWSPDGLQIAYSVQPAGALPGTEDYLYVMQANGTQQRRLVAEVRSAAVIAAAWSPDGARIAFAAQPFGTSVNALFVVNADGGGLANMGVDLPDLSRPAWRPVWWPSAPLPPSTDATSPTLTLDPAQGGCDTAVVVRGADFQPGVGVTLYGAPAGDGSFGALDAPIVTDDHGRFSVTIDPGLALACAAGAPAAGAAFHIGAATDLTERDGTFLSALLATTTFTFASQPPAASSPSISPVAD
jgi:TolB protein